MVENQPRHVDLTKRLCYPANIAWQSWEKTDIQGDGTTILLQAGLDAPAFGSPSFNQLAGTEATFDHLVPRILETRGIGRVIASNRIGAGERTLGSRSDGKPPDRSPATCAAETRAFLEEIGVKEYLFVGHSMAGAQALQLGYTQQPATETKLRGIILIDPTTSASIIQSSRILTQCMIQLLFMTQQYSSHAKCYDMPDHSNPRQSEFSSMRAALDTLNPRTMREEGHQFPDIPMAVIHAQGKENSFWKKLQKQLFGVNETVKRCEQERMLELVSPDHRKFIVAANSNHCVQHDNPDSIIQALQWVLEKRKS